MAETQIIAAREEHRYYPYQGVFYVSRKSFWEAGQDSFSQPPAQNPDMFAQLTNVEPVLQGNLQRRRGYSLFSSQAPATPFTLGYSFRNDLLGLRSVVFTSPSTVIATTESGANYLNPIFTPSAGAITPRMVLSRNYGYFTDGVVQDNKKWDGTTNSNGLTNWGIALNTGTFGPNTATVAADQGGGGTSGNAGPNPPGFGSGTGGWAGSTAAGGSVTLSSTTVSGGSYSVSNFGFNIPVTATIQGIKVTAFRSGSFNCTKGSDAHVHDHGVFLTKAAGVATGSDHSDSADWLPGNLVTYGGSSDLWGTTWLPSDVNNTNFGFNIDASYTGSNLCQAFASIGSIKITVYYGFSGPPASWTNPGNITTCGSAVATAAVSTSVTSDLQGSGFGFAVSGTITGIQLTLQADTSNSAIPIKVNPILVKAGVPSGNRKTLPASNTSLGTLTYGGPFDLWGGTWTATDVNAATFGVQFNCSTVSGTATVSVNCVQLTIFTTAGPITVGAPTGSGSITLLSGRTYFYVFENSNTGTTSTFGPASLSTGPVSGAATIPLSGIPIPADTQADTVLILATADGNDQTTLFLVGSVPSGTTTFNDTTPDTVLLTQPLYQDTDAFGGLHGVANNLPPPSIFFPVKHKGRIYGAKSSTLYFSKNLDEVTTANGLTTSKWEEAWPASNSLDISETAETIKGLLSDGETLWIGTERAVRRLIGDSPSNFQKPEIQFNETGIFNQDVWKIVFYEGQPVGSMWLTPDLRVMSSDFNTYRDVGGPIQDVLNRVNVSAQFGPQASFVSKGPSDYFMLYLPTGSNNAPDTVCVYNLRTQKWFVWLPTDLAPASLFFIDAAGNPRWLFSATRGPIYEWTAGTYQDRIGSGNSISYSAFIQTSWLDFGDVNLRKVLNQFLYLGTDPALTLQVDGAIIDAELDNGPFAVLPPTPVASGPLEDLYVPLAGTNSKHRWYRLSLVSPPSTTVDVLDGFSVEAMGLFRY